MPEPAKDRVNQILAGFVFLFSFIVYLMTVQPTLSYWDCGEFIACSYILGIPHPPGSPLFIFIGRIFSIIPFVQDICLRVNMISVITSALTVLFGYLAVVRIVKFWFRSGELDFWKRFIAYLGGVIGSLLMAFASTYWANAIEAEVYGMSMMLMTMILWLALKYLDVRETGEGSRIIILVTFLAMIGVAVHLSTFLIFPVAAIFFVIRKNAPAKVWYAICCFLIAELLAILAFSDGRGGYHAFIFASIILLIGTAFLVYKHLNWPVLIALGGVSMIMVGFYQFIYGLVGAAIILIGFRAFAKHTDWKTGLAVLAVAVLGFSFHMVVPIRSAHQPRIDENNTSRSFNTFVNFLERKQYGSQSMVERMFKRRAQLSNQFGRHPHMGFWSYFEKQYGLTPIFGLLFLLGIVGIGYSAWKKFEIGLPFLVLILLASVGLILYMNFADGTKYDANTGDAYLEVRNRDYFFTPAYAYFGLALGLGVSALMDMVRRKLKSKDTLKLALPAFAILLVLPISALTANWHENDRSDNYFPRNYSMNMLDTCDENAILFTSGDNDTFPLWCVQEVYNYRKDVKVVNLSLFNTDWYIWQMKWQYGVPISLNQDQIEWHDFKINGRDVKRPLKPFVDRARMKRTYLIPLYDPDLGRRVKLQDMMVDEVYIENKNKLPLFFSSEPYAESPLKLRDKAQAVGLIYQIDSTPRPRPINSEKSYDLYMNTFRYDCLNDPSIYRDENATGVMLGLGYNALRVADDLYRSGDTTRAINILEMITTKYPEFYNTHTLLSDYYRNRGDSAAADSVMQNYEKIITELIDYDPESQFYLSDYGLYLHEMGRSEEAVEELKEAFDLNHNTGYAFNKYARVLYEVVSNPANAMEFRQRCQTLLSEAALQHAEYLINRNDPLLRQLLGL